MPAIDATPGGASANSYATLAEADAYHALRLHADDWTDNGDTDQTKALQWATMLLDQWFDWVGTTSQSTQALLWPRSGVLGPDGYLEANDAIPARIRDATAELARQLLAAETDRTLESDVDSQGLQSLTAGPVSMVFKGSVPPLVIPEAVRVMVAPYGTKKGSGGGGAVTLKRA